MSADDLIRTNLGLLKWRQRQPVARLMRWGAVAAMVLIGLYTSRPNSPLVIGSVILIVAILMPVSARLLQLLQQFEIRRRVRKTFAQHRTLHQTMDVDWSDTEICFATPNSHTRRPWGHHVAWSFDGRVFAVFATDSLYHPIPAAALTTEQLDDLSTRLREAGVPKQ
ncbi:MAG TPA: YcxB family protein [Sphingomonas sp.]|uniref:YcxB family protein n=1 Tax=Sphingomonas sp. TaxID=28214 RepID=UPI002BC935D1|nr:YcxB family protein [Sphingomonas sp.]HMI19049.1 YcxB family protein [Sphingomonas sp.]